MWGPPAPRRPPAELQLARLSLDSAGDMIFWSTVEGASVRYANQTACDILGYTREELLALSVPDLSPMRSQDGWAALCETLRHTPRVTYEVPFRRKDGSLFPVEATSTRIEHEGVGYLLGVVRDISARKVLEADLRQAQASVDTARDMVLWLRLRDKRVTYANPAACRALGYPREELVGLEAWRVNAARIGGDWEEHTRRITCDSCITFETRYTRKDGSTFPVEVSATLTEHEGETYAVGIVRDISEREQAKERLRQETLLNRSQAEVARRLLDPGTDLDAVARQVLERAMELTGSALGYVAIIDQDDHGLTIRGAIGIEAPIDTPREVFTLASGQNGRYRGLLGHSLNTLTPHINNEAWRTMDGVRRLGWHPEVRQMLTIPAVSRGRAVGQLALGNPGRDYTQADLAAAGALVDLFALGIEQALDQQELLAAKERAESMSRAKSDFLSNMTHEVRTPLNGVLGMLQVMQNTGLTDDQDEYVAVALESAERLHKLLGNVIEFARLDAGRQTGGAQAFPTHDLLNALRAIYEPQAREKRLSFFTRLAPGVPELVFSDPQALRHALSQLLDNAIKFTPLGGVSLAAEPNPQRPDCVDFLVEDTGIGIPEEKKEQVFAAFTQADASFTRTFGGAGLGLAIARRLALQLGGELKTRPRPGGGTVMVLTAPVAQPTAQPTV